MSGQTHLPLDFGRKAFGGDPAAYHQARPAYPDAVWDILRQRAGLAPGIDIIEVGAGTGLATGPLLAHEPARLVAVEPDQRLARYLAETLGRDQLEVLQSPFENVTLPPASFDLAVSATAFHWLDAVPALLKLKTLLRPQGAVALVWNEFGDPQRPDAFHEVTASLFADKAISRASGGRDRPAHSLESSARRRDFLAAGLVPDDPHYIAWTLVLDPDGIRRLYASFSNVTVLPPDQRVLLLDALAETAAVQFSGRVERNMVTAIHIAHREN